MYEFEFARPATVSDAVQALSEEDAQALGGGQTLIPTLKQRLAMPTTLVSLSGIVEIKGICQRDDGDSAIGGGTTHGVDEPALDEILELLGVHGAIAEGTGGSGHRIVFGLNADIELHGQLDTHAVLRDQGLLPRPDDFQPQGVHVHFGDVVQDRQHEGAASHDHLLAPEAGPYEGDVLRRAAIEPVQQIGADRDDDRRQDDDCNEICTLHWNVPSLLNVVVRIAGLLAGLPDGL